MENKKIYVDNIKIKFNFNKSEIYINNIIYKVKIEEKTNPCIINVNFKNKIIKSKDGIIGFYNFIKENSNFNNKLHKDIYNLLLKLNNNKNGKLLIV